MLLIRTAQRESPRVGLAWALLLYTLAAFAFGCGLVGWQDPAFVAEGAAWADPLAIAINVVPVVFVALLLLVATRRPVFSLGLTLLLLYVLYTASAMKFELLDTPIVPTDFVLLGHLGDGGNLLLHYVPRSAIAALLLALAFLVAFACWERPWRRLRGARRLFALALVSAFGTSLLAGVRPWSQVYAADSGDYLQWSPTESALHSGLLTTLLRFSWDTAFVLPEPDRALAAQFMHAHAAPASDAGTHERPDIVVLQSESFFDPARLQGLEPEQVLPEFRRIAALSRHGDLWVPAYGGGTIRTEFEVLSGIAMRYFPEVQHPYFRLTATTLPSLPSVLAAHGYRTVAMHPHEREFWNRASALSHLGFDEFDAGEQFGDAPLSGWYVSDEALVDHMLAKLDAAQEPLFLFAISIENHGPYDGFPNADLQRIAAQPVPAGLAGAGAERLRGYLYHLAQADHSLGRLVDALRTRTRRTLLLFYGDHLPALPLLYQGAGFDDGAKGPQQPVPWLLFDSARAPAPAAAESTASFYLPALLLAQAGIDDQGYFSALEAARRNDHPEREWTPVEDSALRAVMQLRQRGEVR
ncbi:LTA synthase family protein [Dokdonella sp.]|uniref:LTA synthase family protein n=1 Tax=Dokdonella sp. TaxID=2291710 RepID=UPI0037838F3B